MSHNEDKLNSPGDNSEGFYSRWSKRKIQVSSGSHAKQLQADHSQSTSLTENSAAALPCDTGTVLSDKDMPELDTLTEDSDYSGFLSPGVSEKLRKLALRKLFRSQSFNLCDGLDDYDEEFTTFEKLGDIVTADMRFQLEQEARRKLQLAAENQHGSGSDTEAASINDEADAVTADEPAQNVAEDNTSNRAASEDNSQHLKQPPSAENENLS